MTDLVEMIASATHRMLKRHTWTGTRAVLLGDVNGTIKAASAKYPRSVNWHNLEGQTRDQGTAVLPQDCLSILYEENAAYAANPPHISIGYPDGSSILTVKGFSSTFAGLATQDDRSQLEQRMDSGDDKTQDDFPTLAVVANDPPSLSVILNAWIADAAGTLYEFPGATLDLTGALPASGEKCIVAVGLQADYATPEYATSTPRAIADAELGAADRQEARSGLSGGSVALRAIAITGDMTEITDTDIRTLPSLDLRQMVNAASSGGGGVDYPTRATRWHDEALVTVGNAFVYATTTSQNYNTYTYQNTAANGDTFTNACLLKAGTYTFFVLGLSDSNRGKIDWYVDAALAITGQDWYAGGTTYNVRKSTGSIVVATDGKHQIKGVVNGKNGSSSDYYMSLTKYWFTPAAD